MLSRNITHYDVFKLIVREQMRKNHPTMAYVTKLNLSPVLSASPDGPSMELIINRHELLPCSALFPYSFITEMRRRFPKADFSPHGESFEKNVLLIIDALIGQVNGDARYSSTKIIGKI